jgi:VWFA-related protein
MRRTLLLAPLLVVLLLVALFVPLRAERTATPAVPGTPGAHVTQVDSSHYPDVTLYVGVTDDGGQPVGGLSARDFAVTEDGQPVTIGAFAGGAGAVSAALVIDRSGSMAEADKIDGAQEAAQAFVDQMRSADRTTLIAFDEQAETLAPFTADQRDLERAIRRLRPAGGTALYDSLIDGVDALANAGGRRALLLLTDGRDCQDSEICPSSYGSQHTLDEAIAYANAHAQPVYVVGLGQRGADEREGIDEAALQRIAKETGGEYFYAPSAGELATLYRTLSSGIQQEYSLTYTSPRPFYDGTRRDIQVSVGGAASASSGYVERHLINVHSDPLVGLLLLLPIAGALLIPLGLRRRAPGGTPASAPAGATTIVQPVAVQVLPGDSARCLSCDAPLLRPGARFCAECGRPQTGELAGERRVFCDQCGRPMRAGAHFCAHCGATALAHTSNLQA